MQATLKYGLFPRQSILCLWLDCIVIFFSPSSTVNPICAFFLEKKRKTKITWCHHQTLVHRAKVHMSYWMRLDSWLLLWECLLYFGVSQCSLCRCRHGVRHQVGQWDALTQILAPSGCTNWPRAVSSSGSHLPWPPGVQQQRHGLPPQSGSLTVMGHCTIV